MRIPQNIGPWLPAIYTIQQVAALQALVRGEATPEQQKLGLDWIITSAARTYDEQYFPTTKDNDGRRDTDYALGKRFVGQQIVKMLKLDLGALKKKEDAKLPALKQLKGTEHD